MLILFIYLAIVKVSINISIDSKLFIKSLEDKVIEIAKKAEFYLSYKERCEQKCKLSYNSCPMDYPDFPLPPLSCNQDFKVKQCANYTQARKLSIDYSSVQLKNKNELVNIDSQDIKHIVCSFSRLDEDFKDLRTDKMFNITKWQYIGAYNGVHRTYPGREKCDIKEGYDPRDRPWYASASSISKTLIIVIDNSESMSDYKKLDNAKTLASRIINSTAISDAAVIINFSDTSESNSNVLVRLNLTERVNAHRYINNISTTNKTANYESAVEKVYEILNTNGQLVVNCKNIVIFITDGESRQHTSPDIVDNISNKFINSIKSKDSNYKTTWITVGIEDNSNYDFLKRISCFTNGITFKMQNNNIQQIVLDYYYFISSLKKANNDPVWVEPYNDTEENGFGIKTTLTVPVYDRSYINSTFLVAVIGVDVILDTENRKAFEKEFNQKWYGNPLSCDKSLSKLTECQLESLRGEYKCSNDLMTFNNEKIEETCLRKIKDTDVNKCQKLESIFFDKTEGSNSDSNVTCCVDEDKFPVWAIVVIVICSIVLIVIAFFIIKCVYRICILNN